MSTLPTMSADILVRRKGSNQIMRRIPVTGLSSRRIDKIVAGLEINMGADYYVDDTPARNELAKRAVAESKQESA